MNISLKRPICFFDIESTGTNIVKDRIVEISILKLHPNQNKDIKTWLVNPGISIPKDVSLIHGITNEDVANHPSFKELAPTILQFIKGSDLAGYNSNRFDIPMLAEEMLRAEQDFDLKNVHCVDVQTIFHKKEKRTLEAAYKFYCNKDLSNAHSAEADTKATFEVLEGQLDKYDDLKNDIKWLADFSKHKEFVDFAGFVRLNKENKEIFSFGKHKGKLVEDVFEKEPGYYGWLQNADFPLYTKKVLTAIKLRQFNS